MRTSMPTATHRKPRLPDRLRAIDLMDSRPGTGLSSPVMLGTHGVMDCCAWLSNFLLACTANGLGEIAHTANPFYTSRAPKREMATCVGEDQV